MTRKEREKPAKSSQTAKKIKNMIKLKEEREPPEKSLKNKTKTKSKVIMEKREPPEKDLQNKIKSGVLVKNLTAPVKISIILIMLIAMASGAQIGTSHPRISIMQINSIEISRKTWISEIPQNIKETLKIVKGPAIISERYVQEAQQIITDLGKPLRIEKNPPRVIMEMWITRLTMELLENYLLLRGFVFFNVNLSTWNVPTLAKTLPIGC